MRFPDGTVISEPVAAQTFAKVLQKIGFDRVERLGIRVRRENIVARSPSQVAKDTEIDGYYVRTHSSTMQKKRHLEEISQRLNLGLNVSVVT